MSDNTNSQNEKYDDDKKIMKNSHDEQVNNNDKNNDDNEKVSQKKNKKSGIKKILTNSLKTVFTLLVVFVFMLIASGFVFVNGVSKADIPDPATQDKTSIGIYASDGVTQLARVYPEDGVRRVVDNNQISQDMKNAIVSAEDRTFYGNPGFAPKRILKAALGHAKGNENAGGASTLTQQYVKNTLVGDEVTLERKWKEVLSATKLTASWEKDDIISSYLNTVFYGRRSIGIEKAAQNYFNVHAGELDVAQSALLAGLVQSPSSLNPDVDIDAAKERFEYVIGQMKRNGYIDENEKIDFPVVVPYENKDVSTGISDANGHIVSEVFKELERKGFDREKLFNMGASIVTTIDPRVQNSVVKNASGAARYHGVSVGVTAIDPRTGSIRGIYGGDNGQGFNTATSPQMHGSVFKVFTLAAGLENGIGLDTVISSAPYEADGIMLNNSDGMTCGSCNLAEATKQSLNTVFYRLQDMIPGGPEETRRIAQLMGVSAELSDDGYVAKSITLGSYGASTAQMASGFATIANNGVRNDTHIVDKVVTGNGKDAYKVNTHPQRVISESTAQQIDSALAPIPAYSNGNQLSGKAGYGKTGTVALGDTGANRDAAMAGYTDNMAVSVWMGNSDGSPLYEAGGSMMWGAGAPATTWKNILNEIG